MIRSRTRASSGKRTAELEQRAGVAVAHAATSQLGEVPELLAGSRAANTSPTGSASSRRATNARVSAEA